MGPPLLVPTSKLYLPTVSDPFTQEYDFGVADIWDPNLLAHMSLEVIYFKSPENVCP